MFALAFFASLAAALFVPGSQVLFGALALVAAAFGAAFILSGNPDGWALVALGALAAVLCALRLRVRGRLW